MHQSIRTAALVWLVVGLIPLAHTVSRQVYHTSVTWLPRYTFYTQGLTRQSRVHEYISAFTQVRTIVLEDASFDQEIPRDFAWAPAVAWIAPVGLELVLEVLAVLGLFSSGRSGATKRMRSLRKLTGRKDWTKAIALIKQIDEQDTGLLSEGEFLELKILTGDTCQALTLFPRALACYRDALLMRPDNKPARDGSVATIIALRKDIPHDWVDTYARVLKETKKPSREMVRLYAASQLHRVRADKKGADQFLTVFTDLKSRPDLIEQLRGALEELMTEPEDGIKARMVLGRELVAARQTEKAVKILSRMLLLEPGQDGVHEVLFETYQEMERIPDLAYLYKETLPKIKDCPALSRALERLRRIVGKELADALRPGGRAPGGPSSESPAAAAARTPDLPVGPVHPLSRQAPPAASSSPGPSISPAASSPAQAPGAMPGSLADLAPLSPGGGGLELEPLGPAGFSVAQASSPAPAAAPAAPAAQAARTAAAEGFSIEGLRQIVRTPGAGTLTGPIRPLAPPPAAGPAIALGQVTAGPGAAAPLAQAYPAPAGGVAGGGGGLNAQLGLMVGAPSPYAGVSPSVPPASAASVPAAISGGLSPSAPGPSGMASGSSSGASDEGSLESLRNLLRGGTASTSPAAALPASPAGARASPPAARPVPPSQAPGAPMDLSSLLGGAASPAAPPVVAPGLPGLAAGLGATGLGALASSPVGASPGGAAALAAPTAAECGAGPGAPPGAPLPAMPARVPTRPAAAINPVEAFRSAVHVYNTGDRGKAIALLEPLARVECAQRPSIIAYLVTALLDEGRSGTVAELLTNLDPSQLSDEEAYMLGTRCELWDLIDWARELYRSITARTPAFRDVAARLAALAEPEIPEAQIDEGLIRRLPARYKGVKVTSRDEGTIVFSARDIELERDVAIKMLAPMRKGHPSFEKRFVAEARALAKLVHPNIVQIYDISREGIPFYSAELLTGWTVDKIVEQGKVPLGRRLRYVVDVLGALDYCHNRGVVHRDVRPENVFVTSTDEVRLVGFGQAMIADLDEQGRPDRGRTTLVYMAPEQVAHPSADPRSDLFSVGCVLFYIVMGEPPFVDVPSVLAAPTPSIAGKPGVVDALVAIVNRCLEKIPESRYQSSREVIDVLAPLAR